jgi:gluconolactonase
VLRPPKILPLDIYAQLPAKFARPRRSAWGDINLAGQELACFLEGPALDGAGNLYVVDIPFGRIFRIDAQREWHLVAEYDGWPNGMKIEADGRLLVADFKLGLVRVDPANGRHEVVFDAVAGTTLHGLNDLTVGPDGAVYVTDQGQTGLHDPRGRVLRVRPGQLPEILLDGIPSPNGIVFDRVKPWLYLAVTRANAVWRVPLLEGKPTKVGVAIQLSGGLGPDGLALDAAGRLLAAHPMLGVWHFDKVNCAVALHCIDGDSYVTNLAVEGRRFLATDSIAGRIVAGTLSP